MRHLLKVSRCLRGEAELEMKVGSLVLTGAIVLKHSRLPLSCQLRKGKKKFRFPAKTTLPSFSFNWDTLIETIKDRELII